MGVPSFLVVEAGSLKSAVAAFTGSHRGVALDFFAQTPVRQKAGTGSVKVVAQALGGPAAALGELLQVVSQTYPTTRVLEGPSPTGAWMAAFEMPVAPEDPVTRAIVRFTDERGLRLRWGRVEDGTVYMRALLDFEEDGQAVADACRAYLAAQRLDADVAVESGSAVSLANWVERMQRLLASQRGASPD